MNKLFAADAVKIGSKKRRWNKTCFRVYVEFLTFLASCRREGWGWEGAAI